LEYVGATLKELQALDTTGPIHPDDRPSLLAAWKVALETGKPYDIEVRRRRADGVYRWFHSRGFPLRDTEGRIVTWYLLGTDIDDRKRAEEALQRAQSELAHVSRMTTLGELAASIAHEVNQPLGTVVNNASACLNLLSKGTAEHEEAREVLREIIEEADRASAVIARVRQLSKKVPYERISVNLREVVTDVLVLARYQAGNRQITIRTYLPDDLPPVIGDRLQLQQVLLNLVVNGMDAMKEIEASKRILIISGRSETEDGELGCLIAVQDAGTGLQPEGMNRLFEAFYSTKPEGMGMGLAISRSIIEAHGGKLWAEANQGQGATFLFRLPDACGVKL
jgi:PAS domain S-box-containing protein